MQDTYDIEPFDPTLRFNIKINIVANHSNQFCNYFVCHRKLVYWRFGLIYFNFKEYVKDQNLKMLITRFNIKIL